MQEEDVKVWIEYWNQLYAPANLLLLSIALTTTTSFLVYNVRKYFKERLKAEACRVMTINIVYTVANLTRAVAYIMTRWVFKNAPYLFWGRMTYYIGYNFWDVIPLSLIMIYHYKHFLSDTTSDETSERVSETTTEASSSPSGTSQSSNEESSSD